MFCFQLGDSHGSSGLGGTASPPTMAYMGGVQPMVGLAGAGALPYGAPTLPAMGGDFGLGDIFGGVTPMAGSGYSAPKQVRFFPLSLFSDSVHLTIDAGVVGSVARQGNGNTWDICPSSVADLDGHDFFESSDAAAVGLCHPVQFELVRGSVVVMLLWK